MADKETRQVKKSNPLLRLLALVVTAALVLGALALVVYRDRLNVDALRRRLSYRSLETSDTGQAAPFTHAGGDRMSLAYLDGRVLTASAAGAHYYALSGELIAEEVAPLDNPVLSVSRTSVFIMFLACFPYRGFRPPHMGTISKPSKKSSNRFSPKMLGNISHSSIPRTYFLPCGRAPFLFPGLSLLERLCYSTTD